MLFIPCMATEAPIGCLLKPVEGTRRSDGLEDKGREGLFQAEGHRTQGGCLRLGIQEPERKTLESTLAETWHSWEIPNLADMREKGPWFHSGKLKPP